MRKHPPFNKRPIRDRAIIIAIKSGLLTIPQIGKLFHIPLGQVMTFMMLAARPVKWKLRHTGGRASELNDGC